MVVLIFVVDCMQILLESDVDARVPSFSYSLLLLLLRMHGRCGCLRYVVVGEVSQLMTERVSPP
ncbi:uncharacterized protein MYCFIDRAFT_212308 [Pseudocercospora fijiensis CIRAD86]|uniref:Uncharacterized protein n=1 Tax=Pseudocercospora fijiensis (strain CIRAD86) TaxID=383855 RepID=M2ZL49_PSEFD|nr:uncharacterized protein MYCFIDRAFT_212308 [Pseudocercospora fijiensis CIRAD86]EME79779.1 hypothetical protein MYCFIDRAFT_212308 [Pseudocercospora fijiensis CIRAD86]